MSDKACLPTQPAARATHCQNEIDYRAKHHFTQDRCGVWYAADVPRLLALLAECREVILSRDDWKVSPRTRLLVLGIDKELPE